MARLPLGTGDCGAVIDYRHLINHLLRKPGAFAGYRWREELFPAPAYRAAFDWLEKKRPHRADRQYLEILKIAADQGTIAVENALEQLLGEPRPEISANEVRQTLEIWEELKDEWRKRPAMTVDLSSYDELLTSEKTFASKSEVNLQPKKEETAQ